MRFLIFFFFSEDNSVFLCRIYLAGVDVDPSYIYPPIEYPVSRSTKSLAPLVRWEHGEAWRIGIEDKMNYFVSVREVYVSLTSPEYRECVGHQLEDKILLPISSILVKKIIFFDPLKSI